MSQSRDLQLLIAAVDSLREAWIVEHRVFEMRGHALADDQLPAIDVSLESSESEPLTIHANGVRHVTTLQVDVCVRETANEDSVARVADRLMVDAHETLMTDATLAGLCAGIELTGREWVDERAAGGILRLRMTYQVEHFTSRTDLTAEP